MIANMRKELEDKDQLISSSADQLAQVQDQLRSTIENVASETAQLKARIDELENLLREKDDFIKKLMESKDQEAEKDDLFDKMKAELEAARAENEKLQDLADKMASFTGDEHFRNMLRESKSAVEKVKEQLENQYDEWDCVKKKMEAVKDTGSATDLFGKYSEERRKSDALTTDLEKCQQRVRELEARLKDALKMIDRYREQAGDLEQMSAENLALRRHSAEVQDVAKEQIEELVEHLRKAKEKIAELEAENEKLRKRLQATSRELETIEDSTDSESMQKLRKELEEVQREKAKLEALIKSLQEGVASDDPQQELMRLKVEYAALEEQLRKEIAQRQEAEKKVKELEEKLASKTAGGDTEEVQKLKDALAKANEENARMERALLSQRTESEQKVARLNRELDDLADTVKEKTRRSSVQAGELEAELQRLKAENAKLQSQLTEAKEALKQAGVQTDIKAAETAVKGTDTSELNALKEERDKLLKQIEKQNKEISGLVEQMKSGADAAAVAEIEKQKREKEELLDLISKLEKQVKDLSTSQQVTDTSDLGMSDAVKKLKEQVEKEERNAKEWKDKYDKCQQELEKLKQMWEEKTGQPVTTTTTQADDGRLPTITVTDDDEFKELKAKYDKCQQELENLRRQYEEKTGEKPAAATETAEPFVSNDDLKQQLADCQQELKKLRGQLREQTSAKNRLSITQLGSQHEIQRLSKEVETVSGKCQEELENLKQQLREKDDLLELEKKKSAATEKELAELQEAMAGDDPDGAFKAMQNKMKDLKAENEELQKEVAALKQKVDRLEEENRKLKEQLAGAVTEVERTRRASKGKKKQTLTDSLLSNLFCF